ncbi:restriction endonuclease subunit S [Streptococcus thermophilus]|nr:restriction endonuclease subunit S [Streptococcus thermophilus]
MFMEQIPKIRFYQFDNKWNSIPIGNLAKIKRGASPRPIQNPKWFDENSDIGWLRISDVTEQNGRIKYLEQKISKLGQEKTRVLNTPHLLLSIAATVGKPVVNYVKTGVHDGFLIFENPKFDREFMFQWFDMFRPKWNKYGQPGSQVNLNSDIIRNHKMMIPSLLEQTAIGSLFRTLDDLLASYKDNLANYQSLKTTMLSKMFPKAGQAVPEIRLDGFKGEWEINKLNKYLTVSKQKNTQLKFDKEDVLSVSGEFGIINQIQFQGRSFAGASVEMYSIVDTGNIVYTKSPLKANPYGIIKTNYGIPGIVSTLYAVYLPNENVFPGFVERYFENDLRLNSYLKPLVNKGAKNDMKVSDENALLGAVIFPQLEEQVAISDYFTNLDKFIQSYKDKITQLETLKKKLLQNLFI